VTFADQTIDGAEVLIGQTLFRLRTIVNYQRISRTLEIYCLATAHYSEPDECYVYDFICLAGGIVGDITVNGYFDKVITL
jgi:hypothetical protein